MKMDGTTPFMGVKRTMTKPTWRNFDFHPNASEGPGEIPGIVAPVAAGLLFRLTGSQQRSPQQHLHQLHVV